MTEDKNKDTDNISKADKTKGLEKQDIESKETVLNKGSENISKNSKVSKDTDADSLKKSENKSKKKEISGQDIQKDSFKDEVKNGIKQKN